MGHAFLQLYAVNLRLAEAFRMAQYHRLVVFQAALLRQSHNLTHAGATHLAEALAHSTTAEEGLVLLHHHFQARAALSGEHHNELHVLVTRRHHGRYGAAFTVAADAQTLGVDMLVTLDGIEHSLRILGKEARVGSLHLAGAGTHATVVVAQYGDAARGQIVSKHQERLVLHQLLVTVLLAAAADQHNARVARSRASWHTEGALEVYLVALAVGIVGRDGLLVKAVWRQRRLRPTQLEDGVGGEESDILLEKALLPITREDAVAARQHSLEAKLLTLYRQFSAFHAPRAHRQWVHGLHGAVELGRRVGQMDTQRQTGLLAHSRIPLCACRIENQHRN